MTLRTLSVLLLFCLPLTVTANNLTDLANNGVQKWEDKVFNGSTNYTITQYKGQRVVKAVSEGMGSGLFLKKKIDLQKTPFINWRWLIEKQLVGINERSRNGEDFVARVYVAIDGGVAVWRSKSLNYVWSSNQNRHQVWNNPFLGAKVKMISIRGKEDKMGQWYSEKRNVYQDLIKQFGDKGSAEANLKAYGKIDVVAIMTDTDNSKMKAESYYGDVIFSAK